MKKKKYMSIQTEVVQRDYDKKFVLWGYTVDPTYDTQIVDEHTIPFIPQRWIMLGVFEYAKEAYSARKNWNNT